MIHNDDSICCQMHAAARWPHYTSHEVQQRTFAGTVAADYAQHFPALDFEADVAQCPEFAGAQFNGLPLAS
jgi:hypothetical protein